MVRFAVEARSRRLMGRPMFDSIGKPISGDITSQILLWDAGTEVNEEPGLGPNQPAFQAAPNTGPAEHGVVRPISEVKDVKPLRRGADRAPVPKNRVAHSNTWVCGNMPFQKGNKLAKGLNGV